MKRKLLIGSIIAVAILIGVSFTSVVGYNNVESNFKTSPLFDIRTQRAINEDSKDLTYDYIGRGESNILSITKRDNIIEMVQRFVDTISKMDESTFEKYIRMVLFRQQQIRINDIEIEELITLFNKLRNNPNELNNYITAEDASLISGKIYCTLDNKWSPGCFAFFTFNLAIGIVVSVTLLAIFLLLLAILLRSCKINQQPTTSPS